MKIIAPSYNLIRKGHLDLIEKEYMKLFAEYDETDMTYLANWYYYRIQLNFDIKPISTNAIYVTEPYIKLVEDQLGMLIKRLQDEASKNNTTFLNFKGILYSKDWGCFLDLNGSKTGYTLFDKISGVPQMSGQLEFNQAGKHWCCSNRYYLSKMKESSDDAKIMLPVLIFIMSVILSKMTNGKQVVIVPPNGKIKTKHEKYVNENPIAVEVWDSRMFNSYVRLEGFPVTGHFRHQRVGEGRVNHRLIWINEFEKHGYNYKQLQNKSN